jgi:hypothetical protein
MRGLVVAVVICSWLAISNHCAFAALAAKSDAPQNECPFHHSKPAKPKSQTAGIQCCKILRAVVAIPAKSWARDDAKFSNVDLRVEQLVLPATAFRSLTLSRDTGPPGKTSFVELVGNVRPHAPPFSVQV